jgi:hypothetical protein
MTTLIDIFFALVISWMVLYAIKKLSDWQTFTSLIYW